MHRHTSALTMFSDFVHLYCIVKGCKWTGWNFIFFSIFPTLRMKLEHYKQSYLSMKQFLNIVTDFCGIHYSNNNTTECWTRWFMHKLIEYFSCCPYHKFGHVAHFNDDGFHIHAYLATTFIIGGIIFFTTHTLKSYQLEQSYSFFNLLSLINHFMSYEMLAIFCEFLTLFWFEVI